MKFNLHCTKGNHTNKTMKSKPMMLQTIRKEDWQQETGQWRAAGQWQSAGSGAAVGSGAAAGQWRAAVGSGGQRWAAGQWQAAGKLFLCHFLSLTKDAGLTCSGEEEERFLP